MGKKLLIGTLAVVWSIMMFSLPLMNTTEHNSIEVCYILDDVWVSS